MAAFNTRTLLSNINYSGSASTPLIFSDWADTSLSSARGGVGFPAVPLFGLWSLVLISSYPLPTLASSRTSSSIHGVLSDLGEHRSIIQAVSEVYSSKKTLHSFVQGSWKTKTSPFVPRFYISARARINSRTTQSVFRFSHGVGYPSMGTVVSIGKADHSRFGLFNLDQRFNSSKTLNLSQSRVYCNTRAFPFTTHSVPAQLSLSRGGASLVSRPRSIKPSKYVPYSRQASIHKTLDRLLVQSRTRVVSTLFGAKLSRTKLRLLVSNRSRAAAKALLCSKARFVGIVRGKWKKILGFWVPHYRSRGYMLKRLRIRKIQRRNFRTVRRFSRRLLRSFLKAGRPKIYNGLGRLEATHSNDVTLPTDSLKLNRIQSYLTGNTSPDSDLTVEFEHPTGVGSSDTDHSLNRYRHKIQSSSRRGLLSLAASSGYRNPKQLFRSVRAPRVRRAARSRAAFLKHLKSPGAFFRPVSTATAGHVGSRDSWQGTVGLSLLMLDSQEWSRRQYSSRLLSLLGRLDRYSTCLTPARSPLRRSVDVHTPDLLAHSFTKLPQRTLPLSDFFFFQKTLNNPLLFRYSLFRHTSGGSLVKTPGTPLVQPNLWARYLHHQLSSVTFADRGYTNCISNLDSVIALKFSIRRRIFHRLGNNLFYSNLIYFYGKFLSEFIENTTGRRSFVKLDAYIERGLTFVDKALLAKWEVRVVGFIRVMGPKIFVFEALQLVCLSLRLKDPTFLANWIRAMMRRLSFWKQRLIFRYIKYLLRYLFAPNFEKFGMVGVKFQLKGKISVAGNARTRTLFYKIGETGQSKMSTKVAYDLSFFETFTGIQGFKLWFFF